MHDRTIMQASIPPSAHLPIELFEQILLHLPPVTLVTTCRLVSPVWKSLIEDTSRPLKHYSTTGRPLSGGASSAGTTGTVTPMASYVLGKFWKKLLEEIPRVNEAPETAPELHTDATVSDLCSCGTPLAELRRYFPQDDAILHKIVPQFEYIIPKVIHINTASTESPNPSIPSMKDRADDASATTREPHVCWCSSLSPLHATLRLLATLLLAYRYHVPPGPAPIRPAPPLFIMVEIGIGYVVERYWRRYIGFSNLHMEGVDLAFCCFEPFEVTRF